jgi:hypothetical protein
VLGQGCQNRAASTGLLGQDSQGKSERKGQAEQERQNRMGRTGQAEQDGQNRMGRTGQDCTDLLHLIQDLAFIAAEWIWALEPGFQCYAANGG